MEEMAVGIDGNGKLTPTVSGTVIMETAVKVEIPRWQYSG